MAITDGSSTLAEKILPPGKQHLENIPGLVSDVLKDAGMSLPRIDAFAAAIGPGSFSGVRIGLAAIKGYCLALNKPILGISSLDILLAQAAYDIHSAIAVIDAGRGDIYAGYAGSIENQIPLVESPVIVSRNDFPGYARKLMPALPVICGGSIIGDLGLESDAADLRLVEVPFPSVCGFIAHNRLVNSDVDDLFLLTPLYLRKSDAEEKALKKAGPLTQ